MDWNIQNANSIHFFGDSLTAGYGTLPQHGWICQISRRCPAIQYYNHGLCGAGLEDIFDSLSPFLSSPHENTLFFMMGGTNDILSGIRVTHLEKMMLSEINKLNKKIPLCIGIPPLMTPLSITTGWQTHFAFTKNNKDLKDYGSFLKANCIDLDILFIDFSTTFPLDNTWYSDGIHPNEKGYSKFADIAAPYMSI